LRLAEGKPIYGPPTLEFVPFLYTPLYPAILALFGKVLGMSYMLARAISVGALVAALALGYRAARSAGTDRIVAAAAMGAVLAAFPFTGAWYDLARNDSLFLALAMGGLNLIAARPSPLGAAAGAA